MKRILIALALVIFPFFAYSGPSSMRLTKVIIDAGHGGKDPGCESRDHKTYEKSITLDVAKRLGDMIKAGYPEVDVVYTRSDDRYVTLNDRAKIANSNNGQLFISIHVNSQDGGSAANGYSVHCLGQSKKQGNDLYQKNLNLCKRENSVILLEEDYSTTYQGFDPNDPSSNILFSLMQNANLEQSLDFAYDISNAMKGGPIRNNRGVSQDPFLLLWATAMPAVLIEIGFISNQTDLAVMRGEEGRKKIAAEIYSAFGTFKQRYDGGEAASAAESSSQSATEADAKPQSSPDAESNSQSAPATESSSQSAPAAEAQSAQSEAQSTPASETLYGIQIAASAKVLPSNDGFFKGCAPQIYKGEKINKYVCSISANLDEVKKSYSKVKQLFPDSFIVEIKNGNIVRLR